MKRPIWKRILVGVIAGTIFSLWIAGVFLSVFESIELPTEEMLNEITFGSMFIMAMFYALPIFLLLGVPGSIIVDSWLQKRNSQWKNVKRIFIGFLTYAIGGIVVGVISSVIIVFHPQAALLGGILGTSGGIAYWGVLQIVNFIGARNEPAV
ncbi:hypothetical protein [Aureibacillus halotolerans]|uniref:Uncharacterized protein n=1 Tax=Aureibacillus halotolerans TaxID=1508390 RepID=A0A4R6UHQ6_9BACI|nr:hypothetical protein [Aureibacillus halotolerans]TDQ42684.1 hypothetical protein EV213_101113 [Aureibacillus halotolerans]